ncbi:hypothetical protein DMA11_04115 [Marinilabiliaceae bacterium JC017]|nr:hypothetical protein DMA11_04115 [Marinilabiliaceae bacterium JC017]
MQIGDSGGKRSVDLNKSALSYKKLNDGSNRDVGKRGSPSNRRAGVGATKMNEGIPDCGLAKIHQGGGWKRFLLRFWGNAKNEVGFGTTSQ